jgi:glutathione synthase/RimK-type ligase-like ATP-grasp enzyme
MSSHIILIENLRDWKAEFPEVVVVTANDYLSRPEEYKHKGTRVINLCRSYRYLSTGYYCSLLAEARLHKVIPTVRTITDLSSRAIYSLNVEDLDDLVNKIFSKKSLPFASGNFEINIFFGKCEYPDFQDLARQFFDIFRCPLFKVEFRFQGKWNISSVKPVYLNGLGQDKTELFTDALNTYLSKPWRMPRAKAVARYDMAILHNPAERLPPSNPAALQKFIRAGKRVGLDVELIEKKDYAKIAEYDALFIRETTRIDHYTYRFSKKGENEGMVVIDDPDSILKCTNKVYMAELLKLNNIPAPKTVILKKGNLDAVEGVIDFPMVLKIPDGSFSRGVFKVQNKKEAIEITDKLFKESDLLLAQEFLYTEFDWRIGILNHKPLYACQYFMSRSHWQVVKHDESGRIQEGSYKTLLIDDAPPEVTRTALAVADLIGNGLYGVDLKQSEQGVYVIEINDNPNIDSGVEDACLGDELYQTIIGEFVRRIEMRKSA